MQSDSYIHYILHILFSFRIFFFFNLFLSLGITLPILWNPTYHSRPSLNVPSSMIFPSCPLRTITPCLLWNPRAACLNHSRLVRLWVLEAICFCILVTSNGRSRNVCCCGVRHSSLWSWAAYQYMRRGLDVFFLSHSDWREKWPPFPGEGR